MMIRFIKNSKAKWVCNKGAIENYFLIKVKLSMLNY